MSDWNEYPSMVFKFRHSNWGNEHPCVIELDSVNPHYISRNIFNSLEKKKDFDFHFHGIYPGNYSVIVGKNATGKTSFLKTIQAFFKFYNKQNSKNEFLSYMTKSGVSEFSCELTHIIQREWDTNGEIINLYIENPYYSELRNENVFHALKKWFIEFEKRLFKQTDYIDDELQWNYNSMKNIGFANDISYEQYQTLIEKHENSSTLEEVIEYYTGRTIKIKATEVISYTFGQGISACTKMEMYAYFGSDFDLPDKNYNGESKEATAFGTFHNTITSLIPSLFSKSGLIYSIPDNLVFNHPSISCEYISPRDLDLLNRDLDQGVLDILLSKEDYYGLSDKLENMDISEIWRIFDIDTNKNKLRTFEDVPYEEDGSEEWLQFRGNYAYEDEKKTLYINAEKRYNVKEDDIKFESRHFNNRNQENLETYNLKSYPVEANWTEGGKDQLAYFSPNQVNVARIAKEFPKLKNFFDDSPEILRFQKDVIWAIKEGLVYSHDKDELRSFLANELPKWLDDENLVMIISRICSANVNEIKAVRTLSELTGNINPHLSSGQARAFSLAKKCSSDGVNILLVDEPEISLHIDWQRKIIDVLRKYSTAQFAIFATHSPDVIYHHIDSVVELDSDIEQ